MHKDEITKNKTQKHGRYKIRPLVVLIPVLAFIAGHAVDTITGYPAGIIRDTRVFLNGQRRHVEEFKKFKGRYPDSLAEIGAGMPFGECLSSGVEKVMPKIIVF